MLRTLHPALHTALIRAVGNNAIVCNTKEIAGHALPTFKCGSLLLHPSNGREHYFQVSLTEMLLPQPLDVVNLRFGSLSQVIAPVEDCLIYL